MPTTTDPYLEACATIANMMDGQQWSPDTLDAIAAVLKGIGFEINEPEAQS